MNKHTAILLGFIICFSNGYVYAGKPVADYAVFTAEISGAANGLWTSKEYRISDKTTGINFNKSGGTAYLYFSEEFIHAFDQYSPGDPDHEQGAGHECFGNSGPDPSLGGTAQIQEMGFGRDSDMVMNLWIHAPNMNPNDDEEIFYVLELFNTAEPAWDPSFPPDTFGSVNTATSWEMRTTSKSYLKLEPCLGSGDSFPGGESIGIEIKRLP
jgi:hypothetical protein